MKTPGVTEEVHFKSSSGYAAIVVAILALLGIVAGIPLQAATCLLLGLAAAGAATVEEDAFV